MLDVQWQEGFFVTAAASAQNSFAVVMSRGAPFSQQVSTACQKLIACRWKLLPLRKPCPLELHRWRHMSLSHCRIDVRNIFRGEAMKRSLVGLNEIPATAGSGGGLCVPQRRHPPALGRRCDRDAAPPCVHMSCTPQSCQGIPSPT